MTTPLHTLASSAQSPQGVAVQFLIVFATASVVTLGLRRLRVATIPAFLVAGAIVGPGLGLVDPESMRGIASLAIILLMFGIGLQLDVKELAGDLLPIFVVGGIATAAVVLLLWPAGMAFGLTAPAALVIALAMSNSSTAAVLRTLQQRHEVKSFVGRMCFGVLIVQDLLAVAFLSLIPAIGGWAASISPESVAAIAATQEHATIGARVLNGLFTIGAITLLIVGGRLFLPRLLTLAAKEASSDVLLVVAGAVALGAAVLTGSLGFSRELGAFIAGFLLAGTPFRHQVSGQLAPMRDLLMAIFFVTVGLALPLDDVARMWWVVLIAAVACVLIKTLGNSVVLWVGGLPAAVAAGVGITLAQAGEFSLVLLAFAREKGAIDDRASAAAIGVVALTLMATPSLMWAARRIGPRLARLPQVSLLPRALLRGAGRADSAEPEPASPAPRVVIAGFGPVGRAVAQRMDLLGAQVVIIELNPSTVRKQSGLGRRIVYGDVSNADVLDSAGVAACDAFILTIPDNEAALRAIREVRARAPGAFIAVRSSYLSMGLQAKQLGADHVTIEEIATAEAMAEQVHKKLEERRPPPADPPQAQA